MNDLRLEDIFISDEEFAQIDKDLEEYYKGLDPEIPIYDEQEECGQ